MTDNRYPAHDAVTEAEKAVKASRERVEAARRRVEEGHDDASAVSTTEYSLEGALRALDRARKQRTGPPLPAGSSGAFRLGDPLAAEPDEDESAASTLAAMTDTDIDTMVWFMARLRGPGVVDPALPIDPDAQRYSAGIRDWANDRMCELLEEQDRRNRLPVSGVAEIVADDE